MRPIKLTLTAFGPYKKTEVFDFTKLGDYRLYVISGNTGAGKTTIFDGICFALYGSASGGDRNDSKMLRSHFADDDTHTAVELIFSIHQHVYRILRQLGHVKQGNKTKTGEKYELFEVNGDKEIPCVDRQIVSDIDKKVEAIIGLTKDQFKQIVMLPQGEFRKLLTSSTENKEAILRRLFKTEHYKAFSEQLREKKKLAEDRFQVNKNQYDQYVKNISAKLPERTDSPLFQLLLDDFYNAEQVINGLNDEKMYYENEIAKDQHDYEQKYQAHDQKLTDYHQASMLNERFVELDTKKKSFQEYEKKKPAFIDKEKQCRQAEKCAPITVLEQHMQEWQQATERKKETLAKETHLRDHLKKELERVMIRYQEEEGNQNHREAIQQKLIRLNKFLPIVEEMAANKKTLAKLLDEGKKVKVQLQTITANLSDRTKKLDNLYGKTKQLEEQVAHLPEKEKRLLTIREQTKSVMTYQKLMEHSRELSLQMEKLDKQHRQAAKDYQALESSWLENQAGMLATHLHDGMSCPVCGSTHHPKKALTDNHAISKKQLEKARMKQKEQENLYHDIKVKANTNQAQIEEKALELRQFGFSLDNIDMLQDQLTTQGITLKQERAALEEAQNSLKLWREQQETLTKEIRTLQQQKDKVSVVYQEKQTKYQTTVAVYDEQIKNIPEDIRDLDVLNQTINETKASKQKLEKAWQDIQTQLQKVKEDQMNASNNVLHAEKQLRETVEKHEKAKESFHSALVKADFSSIEAYQQAKMTEEKVQTLRANISQFNEQYTLLMKQVTELSELLQGKNRTDLTILQSELIELKQAYEQALKKWNQSQDYYQYACDLIQKIAEISVKIRQNEQYLAVMTDLYDVLRGQNEQKISFERYLQIEYLEQIIAAANSRLRKLSNGQFHLLRSERQESHGKQSGLALDVYDSYTGQTRDVKSLSGGEKFNASLCLALGMSDIIQSFQGNISIETMFIDEGFGTLDEESLNKAVDTLIDLQKTGRMIGVISHVQELKNMFPAVLEVSKTKEGNSKAKFVLK